MHTRRLIGIFLLVCGAALLAVGHFDAEPLGPLSDASFTGSPTSNAAWFTLCGFLALFSGGRLTIAAPLSPAPVRAQASALPGRFALTPATR